MNKTKISTILKESTVHQVTGRLIKFKGGDIGELVMDGKCAMGVLSCEDGNPLHKLDVEHHTSEHTDNILREYNIPDDLLGNLPYIHQNIDLEPDIDYGVGIPLHKEIIFLNDRLHLTFDQIAEFLEVTYDL